MEHNPVQIEYPEGYIEALKKDGELEAMEEYITQTVLDALDEKKGNKADWGIIAGALLIKKAISDYPDMLPFAKLIIHKNLNDEAIEDVAKWS